MSDKPIVNIVLVNNKSGDSFLDAFESVAMQTYNPLAILVVNYGDDGDKEKFLALEGLSFKEMPAQPNEQGFKSLYQGVYKGKPFALFSTEKILSEELCRSLAIEATAHQAHVYGFLSGTEKYIREDAVALCEQAIEDNFNMVGVTYPDRIHKGIHSVGQFHNAYFISQLFLQNFKILPNINNINELYVRGHVLNVPEPLLASNPKEIKLDQNMFNKVRARFSEA